MHQLSNSNNQLQLDTIGIKPGEKLYEELMSDEEIKRAVELDNYFSIIPATENKESYIKCYHDLKSETVDNPYNSSLEPKMSIYDIKTLLSLIELHN